MKKPLILPAAAVAGGIAAFALRLLQNRTGFEASTGLPVPGAPAGIALAVWLAVLAVAFFLLARKLPADPEPVFPADFAAADSRQLFLPVIGVLLMAAAGLADLFEGLGMGTPLVQLSPSADPYSSLMEAAAGFSPRIQVLLGILSLLSAAALFPAVAVCRSLGRRAAVQSSSASLGGSLLLMPPVALVIRLVLTYRLDSVNPSLEAYYVELLALVFLTLGFYRLSSFAFRTGRIRRFALYACMAVVLCCAALADGGPHLSSLPLYAGGTLVLLGFLLLGLSRGGGDRE